MRLKLYENRSLLLAEMGRLCYNLRVTNAAIQDAGRASARQK
jgi:hypothetical protein